MTVKFNIMNLTKPDSLFNFGMKISIYSEKLAADKKPKGIEEEEVKKEGLPGSVGWFKGGEHISYYMNGIRKDNNYYSRSFYSLTFSYKFTHNNDKVYFAYCYPYTYTDL